VSTDGNPSLWRISAFERMRAEEARRAPFEHERSTLLSTTMMAELHRLRADTPQADVLEIVAACLRHQEAALLYLGLGPLVWPVTLFPAQQVYHSTRAAARVTPAQLATLRLVNVERAGLRPPGHFMHDRIAAAQEYQPLSELVTALALHGPRHALLADIAGRSAYRLAAGRRDTLPVLPGALGSAALRLQHEATSLRDIAQWPGMSVERASRLLNALYLNRSLMVMRAHAAAREAPTSWLQRFGRRR
jgi:hypothetical protein